MLSHKDTLTHLVSNLYVFIIALAVLSLALGITLMSLAHALGHGDPYRTLGMQETSACLLALAIILQAFAIHKTLQRLSKAGN